MNISDYDRSNANLRPKWFGCQELHVIVCSGMFVQYPKETQRASMPHIRSIQVEEARRKLI